MGAKYLSKGCVIMPRISRKKLISKFYHVIVQGLNKEYIFNTPKYMNKYKEIILKNFKDSNITILSYCIMNNHAHFLIYSDKIEYLSKFMQKINTSYSRFYNKDNQRVGYVFRDRYYTQEILDIKQLYNCVRYIHNNPVKAHIVKSMAEYKYSSFNEFFKINKKDNLINKTSIKLLFEDSDNYLDKFYSIHKKYTSEDFIDIKEKSIKKFIIESEKQYGRKIQEFKNDKKLLKSIIVDARIQTDITIEKLALILDVSKTTVGRYCKK